MKSTALLKLNLVRQELGLYGGTLGKVLQWSMDEK